MRRRNRVEGIPDAVVLDRAIASGLREWLSGIARQDGQMPSSPELRRLAKLIGSELRDKGVDTSHPETRARLALRLGLVQPRRPGQC